MGKSRRTSTTWFGWFTGEAKQERNWDASQRWCSIGLWSFYWYIFHSGLLCMPWSQGTYLLSRMEGTLKAQSSIQVFSIVLSIVDKNIYICIFCSVPELCHTRAIDLNHRHDVLCPSVLTPAQHTQASTRKRSKSKMKSHGLFHAEGLGFAD